MFIATLIAAKRLEQATLKGAADALAEAECGPGNIVWIDDDRAADIAFGANPARARRVLEGLAGPIDIVVQSAPSREKRLLISDMDSTMISVECIDELADFAGLKAQVSEVTERAMRGEIDFAEALTSRVALLAGMPETTLGQCLAERVRPMDGAKTLIATARTRGIRCVLVSGGFHHFSDPVAAELGFDTVVANRLEIGHGSLTGRLHGDIVDAARKARTLEEVSAAHSIPLSSTLSLGDGANDIPMLQKAGLGIAYRAKPAAREAADAYIGYNDLTAVLYALGIPRDQWIER